jgi:RimJ/RimL family protein N-acetyltransferase
LKLKEFEAHILKNNEASQNLFKKIGFEEIKYVEVFQEFIYFFKFENNFTNNLSYNIIEIFIDQE